MIANLFFLLLLFPRGVNLLHIHSSFTACQSKVLFSKKKHSPLPDSLCDDEESTLHMFLHTNYTIRECLWGGKDDEKTSVLYRVSVLVELRSWLKEMDTRLRFEGEDDIDRQAWQYTCMIE